SAQVGAAHRLLAHTPLAQSPSTAQAKPARQGAQAPPQSRSLSPAPRTPSAQLGARQAPPRQAPPAQSVATRQRCPAAHGPHTAPPQSTSLSPALCKPSSQAKRPVGFAQPAKAAHRASIQGSERIGTSLGDDALPKQAEIQRERLDLPGKTRSRGRHV